MGILVGYESLGGWDPFFENDKRRRIRVSTLMILFSSGIGRGDVVYEFKKDGGYMV